MSVMSLMGIFMYPYVPGNWRDINNSPPCGIHVLCMVQCTVICQLLLESGPIVYTLNSTFIEMWRVFDGDDSITGDHS